MTQKLIKTITCSFFFLLGGLLMAQTVTGTVSDVTGPLPGVSVIVKGTTNGVQTDLDGTYQLNNVSNNAIIVFSYLGFKTQEVIYTGQEVIDITLAEDAAALDEVVVIGYGTTTVRDATGSVSSVSAKDFNGGVIASPEQLIQGKAAGVQITQSSGEPGAGIAVRIRGTSSVRSNNNPLFVVDGIPLSDGGTASGANNVVGADSSAKNPLSFLNPNDIESMSILKDASATAIYGSRGANGVIIIKTKSGKAGAGGVFEFNTNISSSTVAKTFDLLNASEYLAGIEQYGGDPSALDFGNNTSWQDVIYRSVLSVDNSLSYANNYEGGYVRGSFSYGNQQGIIENSSQERITGRINASHRFFEDKLKLDTNLTFSRINDEAPFITNNSGSQGDLIGAAYFANPTWPDSPNFSNGSQINPRQYLDFYQDMSKTNRALLNMSAEYTFTDNFKAKVLVGFDQSMGNRDQTLSSDVQGINNGTPGNGRAALQDINVKNKLLDFTVNYDKEFENSKLGVLVGYSYQSFQNYGNTILGYGFSSSGFNEMISSLQNADRAINSAIDRPYQQYGYSSAGLLVNQIVPEINSNVPLAVDGINGVRTVTGNNFNNTDELQSFFTRLNYTISEKYLFTFTLRVDGSSRFGPNNAYGYFPSGAFAWQMHEEDFIPESFSTLKLRVGYGITGNQDGLGYGNFTGRQRFGDPSISNGGDAILGSLTQIAFPNADLKWEETKQLGAGFDFGFMNDRLSGSLDFYHKTTTDLLLQSRSPQPAVQTFIFENIDADVINTGVEFALNYDLIQQEDMIWNLGFNVAYNKNEVQNFDGQIQTGQINGNGLSGAFSQLLAEGQPLFAFYLREFAGFDENGISIYPNGDRQEFVGKSALPDITLGINTSFSYKNWDFNAFLNGQYGQYVYNNTANAFFTAGIINSGQNVTTDVLTNGESAANAPDVSTRFLEKGDFLRLQNASIGYNFNLKEKKFFKTFRLSLNGQNLFVITPYSGLDPEVNSPNPLNNIPSAGIDYTSFPRARTYTLGLNATF